MDYSQILKFNLVLALFILLSVAVNADDIIVEIGNIYAEKSNELFLSLKNTETGGHDYRLVSAGSSGGIGAGKFSIYDATGGFARLTIDTNGNVGIGTANPASVASRPASLIVYKDQNDQTTLQINNPNTGGSAAVTAQFAQGTSELALIQAFNTGAGEANKGLKIFNMQNGGFLQLVTKTAGGAFNDALYIDSNGRVGIGTTTPAAGYKLDVSGKIHATEDICTDLSGGKCLSTVSGTSSLAWSSVTGKPAGFADDVDNVGLTSESDPQVGTLTSSKWCVANSGGTAINCNQNAPAGDSDWTISGTDMYSGVSGKVGIGAAIPKAKLDVAGEVKFGNTGLTCNSDAAGAVRYNSGSKVMEFCDGSAWKLFSGGTTPTPPPAAKTKVQCSVDGSATDTSTTACSKPTCDEVSQNTYDTCSEEATCPNDGWMYVNDVKLEGTIGTGGSVTPSVEVKCYSSGTKWAIYFYDGTSWVEKCKGSCIAPGLEWESCSAFNLPSAAGTYYLRGITSWWDAITASCITTTYGDHDDIKIQLT